MGSTFSINIEGNVEQQSVFFTDASNKETKFDSSNMFKASKVKE